VAEQFDVVVLGGGPGGYAAALYGAAAGLRIALVEDQKVGGTCLHQGCIPAKALLQTAEVLRTVAGAKEFGVDGGQPILDLAVSQTRKQQIIDKLTKGLEATLKGRKVTIVNGTGSLVDASARHLRVSDGSELKGDALIIATGSTPRSLPGLEFDGVRILSSDHVLELQEVPPRVAIIGGGAIGCEFASLLADIGTEVTIIEMLPRILPGVDKQVSDVVARSFRKRGIGIHTDAKLTSIEGTRDLAVAFESNQGSSSVTVDHVVVSIGRAPRSGEIGLDGSGVEVDPRGYILVDGHMRTTVPGVYAVGDVVPSPALAHVGFAEAIVAIKNIMGEPATPVDYAKVPWGIYCHPEVAYAGITEDEARSLGYDVVTAVHRAGGDGRALIIGETDGLAKVVAERDGPILGVHIVGAWATELIAEGYLAVNWEATPEDVASLVHPHPTLSELFGEAALSLTGRSLHG
jgi:dihydrolipoamide dehydrogenase